MAKAAVKIKKEATVSVSDMLRSANKASDKKKKSDVPQVAGHEEAADAAYEAYVEQKDAEATFRAAESEVIAAAGQIVEGRAVAGNYSNSLYLIGKKTPGVLVKGQGKFCEIPVECESTLREATGDDYETFFFEKREIKVKETSDDDIKLLLQKLGKDEFERLFSVKVTIGCKETLNAGQYKLPDAARAIIKPYKMSVTAREE